jgi:hypothetical protein
MLSFFFNLFVTFSPQKIFTLGPSLRGKDEQVQLFLEQQNKGDIKVA